MMGRTKLPLTERAYAVIKERILSNRLPAGAPVPSERLAGELRLGRTPVREALLGLEREGLIEIRPRMGTFVAPLDLRRIHEMYQVRRLLEGAAARRAAGFGDPVRLAALERELRALPTGPDADLSLLSETGQKVHEFNIQSCDNGVLAEMLGSMQDHFRRYRALSLQIHDKVLSSHREHLRIVAALRAGDGESAERLVQAHFEHAARYLVESLLSGGVR